MLSAFFVGVGVAMFIGMALFGALYFIDRLISEKQFGMLFLVVAILMVVIGSVLHHFGL